MLGSVAGEGDGEAKEAGDDDAERERVIRWGRLRTAVEMAFFLRLVFESLSLLDWSLDSDSDFRLKSVSCIEGLGIFLDVWKYWFSLPLKLVFLLTGTSSASSVARAVSTWSSSLMRVVEVGGDIPRGNYGSFDWD